MRRRVNSKIILWLILSFLIVWPIYQLYDLYQAKKAGYDAVQLLYQVSLFQVELLNSFLNEAARAKGTEQLNTLKQAVYSTNYTHERLILAQGKGNVGKLNSVSQLMQYIIRLEIGGNRPLKPTETETFAEVGRAFKELYEAYGQLLSSNGKVVSSQNQKLMKLDQSIADLLNKKLLQ